MHQWVWIKRQRLHALSPSSTLQWIHVYNLFADVLDAGRPIEQEIAKLTKKDDKATTHKEAANREAPKKKRAAEVTPPRVQDQRPRLPSLLFEKAKRENLCLTCLEPDHRARDCPYARPPRPMTQNAEGFQRRGNDGTNQY